MDFKEALDALNDGRPIRRTSIQSLKQIWLVNPKIDPDTDGPSEVFVILKPNGPVGKFSPFDTEDEAKKALTEAKKELTRQWTEYNKERKAFDEASPAEQAELEQPAIPRLHAKYWEDATIEERSPFRGKRINKPFLLALWSDGSVTPWVANGVDLLSLDWTAA